MSPHGRRPQRRARAIPPSYRKRRGLQPCDEGAFQLRTMERVTVVLALLLCAGTVACTREAPQSARDVKNPVPPSAENLKQAKKLFNGYCAPCHGHTGRGDGLWAANLNCTSKPANFTDSKLMDAETDGSLFWKITNGNECMAPWDGVLSQTQRWQLVNLIRTFAKQ
jgi:mono/diheme cytochrome c family protein